MSRTLQVTGIVAGMCIVFAGCKSTEDKPKEAPMEVVKEDNSPSVDVAGEAPENPPTDPGCGADDEMCRVENMGDTKLGWLGQGVTAAVMLEKLGEPASKEARFEEEATGDIYEVWSWPEQGVEADLSAPDMTSDVVGVRHFTVTPPFDGKTERGISLGSTEQEVMAAYPGVIDPNGRPGELIIVGSIYGGMFFRLEEGRVSSIFVGAGAE